MNKNLRTKLTDATRGILFDPPTPEQFNEFVNQHVDYIEDVILEHLDDLIELNNECIECKRGAKQCPVWMCGGHLRGEDNEFTEDEKKKFGEEIDWQIPKLICDDCKTVWSPKL